MALLPVWLSMINWDLQHSCSQIELKSLENWCLSVTPYLENKDGWDYKIYNSVLSCLGRTDVKVCRQSLEKDLIAFKAELEESDVILKVKPFDNDFYNYSNLSKLVLKYNILVSKLLSLINKENKREQINDFVLLQSSKLQTKFLESTSLLVYSILNLKKEKGSTSAGIDNIYFKSFEIEKQREIYNRLKNTKFQLSNKKFKIKKDLPKKAVLSDDDLNEISNSVNNFNKQLMFDLFNKCQIKTIRKNFKGHIIKRVWVPKLGSKEKRPLGIPTIRDRVLQQCIYFVTLPFIEFCSDPLSFGGRMERSANDCVAYLCSKLSRLGKGTSYSSIFLKRVDREHYNEHKGPKEIVKGKRLHKINAKKRRRVYEKQYYIALDTKIQSRNKLNDFEFYKYINVDIKSCFDEIDHDFILRTYPIVDKYKFLIKALLNTNVYGLKDFNDKIQQKFQQNKGVPQGSILGPGICNNILNGLELFITNGFTKKYYTNNEKTNRVVRSIDCIRFIDYILIVGKSNDADFIKMYNRLIQFLEIRGLRIKMDDSKKIKKFELFSPGNKFSFLGFNFINPDKNSLKFKQGKFTKYNKSDFVARLKNLDNAISRSRLLITIRSKSIRKIKLKLIEVTKKNNAFLEVKNIIYNVNEVWRGILNYFSVTLACRQQLRVLEVFLFIRIKKLLYWKFNSKPKLHSFIFEHYYRNNTWMVGNLELVRINTLRVNNHRPLHNIAKSRAELEVNIFLDKKYLSKKNLIREVAIIKNLKFEKNTYSRLDLKKILLIQQNYICNLCNSEIEINATFKNIELDHQPSVSKLIFEVWNKLSKSSMGKEMIDSFLIKPETNHALYIKYIQERLLLKVTHKQCNRNLGYETKRLSVLMEKEIKHFNTHEDYKKFLQFRTVARNVIRRWSNYSTMTVVSKRNYCVKSKSKFKQYKVGVVKLNNAVKSYEKEYLGLYVTFSWFFLIAGFI